NKGYLTRERQGKAFVYSPRFSREDFEREMAQEVLGALLGGIGEPVLSTFVELVGEDDSNLDRLEELIKARREGKKQEPRLAGSSRWRAWRTSFPPTPFYR